MRITQSEWSGRAARRGGLAAAFVLAIASALPAATPTVSVDAGKAAGPVSPRLYGLMTEEINHSYDGGLYGELVRNRSFLDDVKAPASWSAVGGATLALDADTPLNPNQPTSLRVEAKTASADAPAGVSNEGYWGFPVRPNTTYRATFFARAAAGFDGPVTLSLQDADGKTTFAKASVTGLTGEWKKFEARLTTGGDVQPTAGARYALTLDRPGTVNLAFVSLFPPTYNDRPNGLRRDLMQLLVDMKPKFLRFPGGNFVEGGSFATRYDWKKTIGPVEQRPGHPGCWGYRSSDGMGLLEFLEWTQDMGAEPVLAVFAGYTLDKKYVAAGPELQKYVDEALQEIEYVTGDASTEWGKRRIADGHPEPFKLNYVEVGNEDWFDTSDSYQGRFAQFYDAIKAKYPQLKVISTVGNEQPKWLVKSRVPDAVDEHYYRSADEFIRSGPTHYEKYSRDKRPEIFVGEWASHEDGKIKPWSREAKRQPPTPSMKAALGDAAFMASMERNSDLIVMQCYAPLLVNVNPGAWQWRPNLIGYDAMTSFGSPSYHAIRMFATHVGDERLTVKASDTAVQASATRDAATGEVFLKLVNPTADAVALHLEVAGAADLAATAKAVTLAGEPEITNSIDKPTAVLPSESSVDGVKPAFEYTVPAHGIVVLTLRTK